MRKITAKTAAAAAWLVLGVSLPAVSCGAESFDTVQRYGYVDAESESIQDDFLDLYDMNEDIAGWLRAGDSIDYPVVQRDNDFYLHHDYYGGEDNNGTLFVNEYNVLHPRDWLVIIHGHHMKSGAMFGRLQDYEDFGYVCRYPLIIFRTVYDPEDVYYVPVAAFNASMVPEDPSWFYVMEPWDFYYEEYWKLAGESETDNGPETDDGTEAGGEAAEPETDNETGERAGQPETGGEQVTESADPALQAPDFTKLAARLEERKQAYLEAFLARSLWKSPVDADADDEYLMLSTCSYEQEDGRFLFLCRKLRDGETPETVREMFTEG